MNCIACHKPANGCFKGWRINVEGYHECDQCISRSEREQEQDYVAIVSRLSDYTPVQRAFMIKHLTNWHKMRKAGGL